MAKIWIVEDDPSIGMLIELTAKKAGHGTRLFSNAQSLDYVLSTSEEGLPDLLLLDLMLRRKNGFEILAEWKKDRRLAKIPVIIISALSAEADKVHGLEPVLEREVEYGHWKRDITEAKTVEEIREVRFSLYESEYLIMTREQISELHKAIDHKETMLTADGKAAKHEEKEAGKILEAKNPQPYESTGNPEIGKEKIR